jgi:hypothetical protein
MSAVLGLIQELADYEKSQMVLVTADDLRDGFGSNPLFHVFVAEVESDCRHCIVLLSLPTWKGK